MTDDLLIEKVRELGVKLGMKPLAIDKAVSKHRTDLRTYYRKLRDRNRVANAHLESEHNRRWFDQESIKSEVRHKKEKEEQHRQRLQQRAQLPLGHRLQSVLAKAQMYDSRAKSPSLGHDGGVSAEGPLGPPGAFTDQPPMIDLQPSTLIIEKHLERMEARVDAFLGLRPPVQWTEKEKAELLDSLVGIHSAEVAASFPELGSQRTIEIWRKDRAETRGIEVHPSTGVTKT